MSETDAQIDLMIIRMLRSGGKELTHDPSQTRYLRDIQVELRELSSQTTDPNITFLLFFIPLLIDDIYYNLVGDIVGIETDILDKYRKDVFYQLGDTFLKLAFSLERKELNYLYDIYRDSVVAYLRTVIDLNRKSEENLVR